MPKVFISYSHKDEDWKNRLQTQLSVLENQGLLSIWDDRRIVGGDDWYPEIERAIESAQVAILLISADFLSSKFIQGKEVPPLLERRKKDGLRVIPLILRPCPWQVVEWLSKIQGRPIDNKPLSGFDEHYRDHHLSELALEINSLLSAISPSQKSDATEEVAPPPTSKPIYDPRNPAFLVPFRAKGKFMVGREQALEKVRQQLLEGKPTSIGQTALFQGMGGLGKTQLAVEYAYQYRDVYTNGVYWITADENIDAQLTQIAVAANWVAPESEHATKLDVARHRIKSYSDSLIVFDNLESTRAIRDYLPEPSANPHILVTSRSEQPEFTDVKLDLLDDKQSYSMLVQEAGRQPANSEEENAAHEIAATLGGLPLALELAGAYLAHRPISWCAYRDMLRDNLKQALPTKLASLTRHEADLFKTLTISEQEISEEPLLAKVLDLLTWGGSSPMGLRLMMHLLEVQPTQLHGALGLGVALRLLQQVPDSERYAIHRLVQEVRRQNHPLTQRIEWVVRIAERMGDWLEEIRKDFRELPVFELEFEHLSTWQTHAQKFSPDSSVRLLWLQAYPAYHRGHYEESYQVLQRALAEYEVHGLDNTPLKANLLSDLAYILLCRGAISDSLKIAGEALQLRRDCFGDIHPDVASSLNNLVNVYSALGDYLRALDLGKQALNMRRILRGARHSEIAESLNSLSAIHSKLKEHSLALDLGTQAFEMARDLYGDKHPHVATTLSSLASCYGEFGDYPRAIEFGEQAHKMRRELFGEKHPDIATSLNNLGTYHAGLHSPTRALEYGLQALEMQRELLGEKHPEVSNTLNNNAHYYERLGDHFRALDHGKQALSMRCELLGFNHPDTINSLEFVAERLFRNPLTAGRGKTLIEDFLKHISRDQPSHEKVLSILNTPRNGFRTQGKISHKKKQKKKR